MKSKIEKTLSLERIDENIFVGPIVESHFIRTFGGQIAAQTLVAATQTVDSEHAVHSCTGTLSGPGKLSSKPCSWLSGSATGAASSHVR